MRNHVEFREARDGLNAAAVVVLQITWSPLNGWHPHYHVMWFIDCADIERFRSAVAMAWHEQTERRGKPARQVHTELVKNRQGFWVYLKDGDHDPRHPRNDCLHPDHMGCDDCLPRGTFRGQPVKPVPPPTWPRFLNFEVFTELGSAALSGSPIAQGLLAHYISNTAGFGRIRRLSHLSKRFGTPPVEEYQHHEPGGERLWIAGDVISAVELANRGTGSPLDWIESPKQAAAAWTNLVGRLIEIGTAPDDDGAPILQFANE